MFDNQKILVIGGTGSWGQELVRQILERYSPKKIIIYTRGEHKQVDMMRKFNDKRLEFVIGDIRDLRNLMFVGKDVDYIFHLAALKHVPICEKNPEETVKTNILGTQNVVSVALENKVKKCILVSTDKAVDPVNTYGVSKSMAEKIIINANLKSKDTKFVCIRAGNVLGTKGSVVPLFKEQIKKVNKITLTDDKMTRYMMRLTEAIALIFKAVKDSDGGEIFVTKMPSIRTIDLAKVMIKELGDKKTEIINIGIRPGEKIDEVLVSRYEADRSFEYGNYYVILPTVNMNRLHEKWKGKTIEEEYNSRDNHLLSEKEIIELLKSEGWLSDTAIINPEGYTKEELIDFFKRERWWITK